MHAWKQFSFHESLPNLSLARLLSNLQSKYDVLATTTHIGHLYDRQMGPDRNTSY